MKKKKKEEDFKRRKKNKKLRKKEGDMKKNKMKKDQLLIHNKTMPQSGTLAQHSLTFVTIKNQNQAVTKKIKEIKMKKVTMILKIQMLVDHKIQRLTLKLRKAKRENVKVK